MHNCQNNKIDQLVTINCNTETIYILCRCVNENKTIRVSPQLLQQIYCNTDTIFLFWGSNLVTRTKVHNRNQQTGENIFDMRHIFILIHQGLHFMCAVICMEQKKIEYYNSLQFNNVTRHGCRHKIKMQEDNFKF
jgi:hypothetical protein